MVLYYNMKKIKILSLYKKNIKKYTKNFSIRKVLYVIVGFGLLILGIFAVWVSTLRLPDFQAFTENQIKSSTKIYDRTGKILLYDIHEDITRTVIPYEEMGINIKNATIAIEDSEFYNHNGIRISSIFRATIWSKITGKKVTGGSTITQQLIKNALLTRERTITRKVKEWILAIKIEKVLDKDTILSLYLNEAPYGGSIYGIEEASKYFFSKNAKNLSIAEAAYLAAIPNGPTYYSPYGKNRDKLEERKNLVLKRLIDLNFIEQEEYDTAKNEVVVFKPKQITHITAPHFVFFIKDYFENKYGIDNLENSGFKIITTLDYELQKKTEEVVLKKAKENEKNWGGSNASVVIIDPKNGQILSMVGSRNYFDEEIDGNFNVATAKRQPGSSFKPIIYALAFEKGYTEKTTLFDVKTEFNSSCNPNGLDTKIICYTPDNYDDNFRGPMTFRDALAQSINVIAVKLLYLVGVSDSIKMAHNLGITTLNDSADRYGLSLVIGGGETTLLDMTSVYSVFANGGIRNPHTGILLATDDKNNTIEEFKNENANKNQILQKNTTNILSSILSDNTARIPTFGEHSVLEIPNREVAVKTGTTNNNKDAWTIGYTPSVVVGVWVGNNDNKPMKKGGVSLAGPIWNRVISEALIKLPTESFEKPNGINQSIPPVLRGFWQGGESFVVDIVSGNLATEFTPFEYRKEIFITNVHSILHWIDKNNPLEKKTNPGNIDSQYNNWEYGIQKWWENNNYKYNIITETNKPKQNDNIHTEELKPVFEIIGLENKIYKKDETINIIINSLSQNPLEKVDVFINEKYLTALKKYPLTTSFIPYKIENIKQTNTLSIIGVDSNGNIGEKSTTFLISDL